MRKPTVETSPLSLKAALLGYGTLKCNPGRRTLQMNGMNAEVELSKGKTIEYDPTQIRISENPEEKGKIL
jgi:hypothetical protein